MQKQELTLYDALNLDLERLAWLVILANDKIIKKLKEA